MTKENIAKWLGRPLTSTEEANFESYLNTAKSYLNSLLCVDSLDSITEERVFDARNGYSTVFTGYFEGEARVSINGTAVESDKFSQRLWDNRNSDYFNSIVFKEALENEEVSITASWGFDCPPSDLGKLYAQLFVVASTPYKPIGDVKSKRVRNFTINFGDRSDTQLIVDSNLLTINKYALCNIGNIQQGDVCHGRNSI